MVNLIMVKKKKKNSENFWKDIKRVILVFESADRKKLVLVTGTQIVLGFLDLLGVAFIGMVSALIIRGINSEGPGNNVGRVLNLLRIDGFSLKNQVLILSLCALLVLTAKTFFSIVLIRKTLRYLGRRSASISSTLISKLLNQSLPYINKESHQDRLFSITSGVSNLTTGVFGSLVLVIADFTLLIILLAGLLIVDPLTSILTFCGFSFIGYTLYYLLHSRASAIGKENSKLLIKSNNQIIESIAAFRESSVRGSKQYYAKKISQVRTQISDLDAEIKFLPNISKYVTEIAIVVGITLIAAYQFANSDSRHATAVLTVFLAASTRIAPALMRLQQNVISLRTYLAMSEPTLKLSEDLMTKDLLPSVQLEFKDHHEGFIPSVNLEKISFTYSQKDKFGVRDISLRINPGTFTALVGPSGAGKSTLADLILGILTPHKGDVQISGVNILETLRRWPGSVGYVPQSIFIANGTIAENVCLGFDVEMIQQKAIWEALDAAEIGEFVRSLPQTLEYQVGDGGANLSGGQRQRIGIARALLTKPLLVVFDEATSALDAEIESRVTESIYKLKGKCTLIVIAHRLSTVRLADQVCFLNNGAIEDSGTFEEIKTRNPEFKNLANLMGL